MWLRADGIVQVVWVPGEVLGLDDAVAATESISALTGGRPCPLLVDVRGIGPQDRQARSEFVRRSDLVSAVALIVGTALSRMMSNLLLAVSMPVTPTRLFEDEGPAVDWLSGFLP
jgi:hypothetical protein